MNKLVGIQFPLDNTGKRSTTSFSKKLWANSILQVNPTAANSILKENNWRKNYSKYVEEHVCLSLMSTENALNIAKSGINFLYDNMKFITRSGEEIPLRNAFNVINPDFKFHTGIIKGENRSFKTLKIFYNNHKLKKKELINQLKTWEKYGTIESSVTESIISLLNNPDKLDLSDQYFILFGAGSAMGPFKTLLSFGANIIAVDINRPLIWKTLFKQTKRSAGTLFFPISVPQTSNSSKILREIAGCNLLTESIEIGHWLRDNFCNQYENIINDNFKFNIDNNKLTVGSYVYLDGEKHVRLVLSCDAITCFLKEKRKINFAYLCTPTDCHPIPKDARDSSLENYNSNSFSNIILTPVKLIGYGRWLNKNMNTKPINTISIDGNEKKINYIVNAIVNQQGPNYILAKRIQHWRAVIERSDGMIVSTNIAPSTATSSVVHQKTFAWAYDGMPFFPPMEIFNEKTSSQLMAALLINDIQNISSSANPNNILFHPMDIFKDNSVHGGIWRMAYTMNSISEPSAAVHFIKVFFNNKGVQIGMVILSTMGTYKLVSKL